MINPDTYKACPTCREVLPLEPALWRTRRGKACPLYFVACRPCVARAERERRALRMADPDYRERERQRRADYRARVMRERPNAERARNAANARRYYRRHRRKEQRRARERYAKRAATPMGRFLIAEEVRLRVHLKALDAGQPMRNYPVKSPFTGKRVPLPRLMAVLVRDGWVSADE